MHLAYCRTLEPVLQLRRGHGESRTKDMVALQSLFGGAVLIALCWALSEDRRRVPWRMVLSGLALGVILAVALLKVPPLAAALVSLNGAMTALENALAAGTGFVFGHLGGGPA